jgi:hypothetical protein
MSYARALDWLRTQQLPGGAMPVSSDDPRPYPEVTGYCLPTLVAAGEVDRAGRALGWLLRAQHEEGYWTGPDGAAAFWFDTAIVAGSLGAVEESPEVGQARARAVGWLEEQCAEGHPPISAQVHDPDAPHEINLLGLSLHQESPRLSRVLDGWMSRPDHWQSDGHLQHFYAYVVEAIMHVDRRLAWWLTGRYARARRLDGSLAAYYAEIPGGRVRTAARWCCYPALAQWAMLWARSGFREAAREALAYLEQRQRPSGGITGGDGPYFPDSELTWAAKYYLDARLALGGPDD